MRAQAGLLTYFAGFLMLISSVLLVITTITSPVLSYLSLMDVHISEDMTPGNPTTQFGTFGYCQSGMFIDSHNGCSETMIGYNPADVVNEYGPVIIFKDYNTDRAAKLTKAMVLHPITCGLGFITFLTACVAGMIGTALPFLLSLVTMSSNLAVLITDFVGFSVIYNAVNNSGTNSTANWGTGIWLMVSGFAVNILAALLFLIALAWTTIRQKQAAREELARKEPMQDGWAPPDETRRNRWI